MARKMIVANWKMNLGPTEALAHIKRLGGMIKAVKGTDVVICPPFVDLYPLAQVQADVDGLWLLGSQNINEHDEGPYTGEVSGAQMSGLIEYSIIGHSERRAQAGERDAQIAAKVAAARRHDLRPILCVGDTLIDREHGHATTVVNDQLNADLAEITAIDLPKLTIAYEPVWALSTGDGKGHFATPDIVEPMVRNICRTIDEIFGAGSSEHVSVLYGGSVNPDNIVAFMGIDGIDGVLVGGASLVPDQFAKIIEAVQAK